MYDYDSTPSSNQHPAYATGSYEHPQESGLLPFCGPHAKLTLIPSHDIPSREFNQTDQDEGGRLELHRDVKENSTSKTQDEFLHLFYYPRHHSEPVIEKALPTQTEIYQESFATFLLRIPNEFHCEDVPSSEQDPGVFDNYRLQFYASLEGNYEGALSGEYAKEFDGDYSIRTWGDFIDRLSRIFHQYTTFMDPSLGTMQPYQQQQEWPDEKKGGFGGFDAHDAAGSSSAAVPSYDPSTFKEKDQGRLMFVDETTGSPVLNMEGAEVQTVGIQPGIKDPVEIILPTDGSDKVIVRPADYMADAQNPIYANSSIVSTALGVSHFIVTTSDYISKAMLSGADTFTKKVKPNEKAVTFSPATHNRVQQFHNFSQSAAKFSSKAVHTVMHYSQNIGAKVAGKGERGGDPNKKPGILNKSMIAFGTVADGVDYSLKNLLHTSSGAVTTVVGHKYGDEARQVAHGLGGSVRNVGLVYVDASGVSRRAVIKSVAKGMVVGRVKKDGNGNEELIVYGGNGSEDEKKAGFPSSSASQAGDVLPPYEPGSYDPNQYQEKPQGAGYSQLLPSQAYHSPTGPGGPSSSGALRSSSPTPSAYTNPMSPAVKPSYGPQDSSVASLGIRGLQNPQQGPASGRNSPSFGQNPTMQGGQPPKY